MHIEVATNGFVRSQANALSFGIGPKSSSYEDWHGHRFGVWRQQPFDVAGGVYTFLTCCSLSSVCTSFMHVSHDTVRGDSASRRRMLGA